jgi:hypothetical protein
MKLMSPLKMRSYWTEVGMLRNPQIRKPKLGMKLKLFFRKIAVNLFKENGEGKED